MQKHLTISCCCKSSHLHCLTMAAPSNAMSRRTLDTNYLLSMLYAVNFTDDNALKSRNEDPEGLRAHWFSKYSGCPGQTFSSKDDKAVDESLLSVLNDTPIGQNKFVLSGGVCRPDLYVIWFNEEDDKFYSITVDYEDVYDGEMYIYFSCSNTEPQVVDFVALANKYPEDMDSLCNTWTYEQVIKQVRVVGKNK